MNYNEYKNRLSRFGFAPNGKSPDQWGFALYTTENGCYDVSIYLDEYGNPFEFRVDFSCGKTDAFDVTFNTFSELLDKIRETKKRNR